MSFEKAIEFALKWEGGYINHPDDPGGETNFGISKRAYPSLDIANLTEEQAKEIYRRDYWDKCGCNSLPEPEDLIVFDTAINMGIGRALKLGVATSCFNKGLQPLVKSQSQQSVTLDWRDYLFRRIEFYNQFNKPMFLKGWINRVLALYKEALKAYDH